MSEGMIGTRRITGLAGIGAAALFGVGSALWVLDQPSAGAPTRQVVSFYSSLSSRIVIGASLSLLAIPLLVLFARGVRAILREHEDVDLFATTAFGGALLFCAAGLGAETINMIAAQRAGEGRLTTGLARALFEISYALGYNAAGVGAGVLILAVAAVALRSRALLDRPVAIPMLIFGCLCLTPLSRYLMAVVVLLLVVCSARLLRACAPQAAASNLA